MTSSSSPSEYRPLIIAYRNGAPVRISDVGTVIDSVEDIRASGFFSPRPGVLKPSVLMIIFRQPGANIIDAVDRIRAAGPQLMADLPQGIEMSDVVDRTTTIRASVHDVQMTLALSVGLVILVVFMFLRDVRATFIPSVAVPVSLIGTFGVMYLCGYSVDNLSLMALTISTGFVVDDAIVVLENINRYLEAGMQPMQAALKGAAEIGFTVLSISVSLVAVFIPILMMGGIIGRLFREFAVTISVAIAVSMVVSLTTTPMMCAWLLKAKVDHQTHGRVYQFFEAMFDWVLGRYESSLQWVLRHQFTMIIATLLTIGLTGVLFVKVPKGFFPQQDTSRLSGTILADQDTSFQQMDKLMTAFTTEVSKDPDVENLISVHGRRGRGGRPHRESGFDVRVAQAGGKANACPSRHEPIQNGPSSGGRDLRLASRYFLTQHAVLARTKSLAGSAASSLPSRARHSICRPTRTCGSAPAPAARSISTPCRTTI